MSPSSLYKLAFNKTCRYLWEESPLPTLDAEFTHKNKNKYVDAESEGVAEYQKKYSLAMESIQERLEQTGKVPLPLRQMIMNVVNSLGTSIFGFMAQIVRGLTRKTLDNIKFCVQHAVYTENLSIDMTESICNILHMSKFDIKFTKSFLGSYCVKKSKLKSVYVQVCNELGTDDNVNTSRRRKSKRCSRQIEDSKMENVYDFIEDMTTGKKFWEKRRHQDGLEDTNNDMIYATDMQYVSVVGPFDALKYYYERACREFEGPDLDDCIFDCAKYLLLLHSESSAKLAFFHEKLNGALWAKLLQDNFDSIFLIYLGNWRYRDRCMPLFFEVQDKINIKTFHTILASVSSLLMNKYDSYGTMAVIKHLWDEVPTVWKRDGATVELVSSLFIPSKKFDELPHFLKEYCAEVKVNIFARIIFELVSSSEESHVETLMEVVAVLGFEQKEGKHFLTNKQLQSLLIRYARSYSTVDYDKVSKYLCNSKVEETGLKQGLLLDKYFIIDFLVNIRHSLRPFLKWAFKDETDINAYKDKLLEDELVDLVYERRLIESDPYEANKIFSDNMLNINEQTKATIQARVKDCSAVIHWCLKGAFIETHWFSIKKFFEDLAFSRGESEELMREFLYLPETIEAVYDMILDLPNFEISMECSREASQLMLIWINFIEQMVKPYVEVNDYKDILLSDIDSVVKHCYEKVQRHPKFGRLENAEFNIKIRFRCFTLCFEQENLDLHLQNNLIFAKTHPLPFMFGWVLSHTD